MTDQAAHQHYTLRRTTPPWQRHLSFVLAIALIATSCPAPQAFAAGSVSPLPSPRSSTGPVDLARLDLSSLTVPAELGDIVERWQPADLPPRALVIHIQDLHTHPEAQRHIAELIGYLHSTLGIELVALEGAEGMCDTSPYTDLPDPTATERIATLFLNDGLFTGAEYYAMTHPHEVTLWGVENATTYLAHLQTYQQGIHSSATAAAILQQLLHFLVSLRSTTYPSILRQLVALREAYEQNGDEQVFRALVDELRRMASASRLDLKAYPHVIAYTQAEQLYAHLDMRAVEADRKLLIHTLYPQLSSSERRQLPGRTRRETNSNTFQEEDDERLAELGTRHGLLIPSVESETPPFSVARFVLTLLRGIPVQENRYHAFRQYLAYIKLTKQLHSSALRNELEALEEIIEQAAFTTDQQRALSRLFKQCAILDELIRAKLSPEHYQYYQQHRREFTTPAIWQALQQVEPHVQPRSLTKEQLDQLIGQLPVSERFYLLASQRNDIFARNVAQQLNERNLSSAILVTGGFHTLGITQRLRDRQMAYLVISPTISTRMNEVEYRERLENGTPTMDELLQQLNRQTLVPVLRTGTIAGQILEDSHGASLVPGLVRVDATAGRTLKSVTLFLFVGLWTYLFLQHAGIDGVHQLLTWIQAHAGSGLSLAQTDGGLTLSALGDKVDFNLLPGGAVAFAMASTRGKPPAAGRAPIEGKERIDPVSPDSETHSRVHVAQRPILQTVEFEHEGKMQQLVVKKATGEGAIRLEELKDMPQLDLDPEYIVDAARDPHAIAYLIEERESGKPVAYVLGQPSQEEAGLFEIISIVTLSSYRGRGIGNYLMGQMIGVAREQKFARASAYVLPGGGRESQVEQWAMRYGAMIASINDPTFYDMSGDRYVHYLGRGLEPELEVINRLPQPERNTRLQQLLAAHPNARVEVQFDLQEFLETGGQPSMSQPAAPRPDAMQSKTKASNALGALMAGGIAGGLTVAALAGVVAATGLIGVVPALLLAAVVGLIGVPITVNFLTAGGWIIRAFILHGGIRGPDGQLHLRDLLLTPIATPQGEHPAFSLIPQRLQDSIRYHEIQHARWGEIGAHFFQSLQLPAITLLALSPTGYMVVGAGLIAFGLDVTIIAGHARAYEYSTLGLAGLIAGVVLVSFRAPITARLQRIFLAVWAPAAPATTTTKPAQVEPGTKSSPTEPLTSPVPGIPTETNQRRSYQRFIVPLSVLISSTLVITLDHLLKAAYPIWPDDILLTKGVTIILLFPLAVFEVFYYKFVLRDERSPVRRLRYSILLGLLVGAVVSNQYDALRYGVGFNPIPMDWDLAPAPATNLADLIGAGALLGSMGAILNRATNGRALSTWRGIAGVLVYLSGLMTAGIFGVSLVRLGDVSVHNMVGAITGIALALLGGFLLRPISVKHKHSVPENQGQLETAPAPAVSPEGVSLEQLYEHAPHLRDAPITQRSDGLRQLFDAAGNQYVEIAPDRWVAGITGGLPVWMRGRNETASEPSNAKSVTPGVRSGFLPSGRVLATQYGKFNKLMQRWVQTATTEHRDIGRYVLERLGFSRHVVDAAPTGIHVTVWDIDPAFARTLTVDELSLRWSREVLAPSFDRSHRLVVKMLRQGRVQWADDEPIEFDLTEDPVTPGLTSARHEAQHYLLFRFFTPQDWLMVLRAQRQVGGQNALSTSEYLFSDDRFEEALVTLSEGQFHANQFNESDLGHLADRLITLSEGLILLTQDDPTVIQWAHAPAFEPVFQRLAQLGFKVPPLGVSRRALLSLGATTAAIGALLWALPASVLAQSQTPSGSQSPGTVGPLTGLMIQRAARERLEPYLAKLTKEWRVSKDPQERRWAEMLSPMSGDRIKFINPNSSVPIGVTIEHQPDGTYVMGKAGVQFTLLIDPVAIFRIFQLIDQPSGHRVPIDMILRALLVKELSGVEYATANPLLGRSTALMEQWVTPALQAYLERVSRARAPEETLEPLRDSRLAQLVKVWTALIAGVEAAGYVGMVRYLSSQNISPEALGDVAQRGDVSLRGIAGGMFVALHRIGHAPAAEQPRLAALHHIDAILQQFRAALQASPIQAVLFNAAYGVEAAEHRAQMQGGRIVAPVDPQTGRTSKSFMPHLDDPHYARPKPEELIKWFGQPPATSAPATPDRPQRHASITPVLGGLALGLFSVLLGLHGAWALDGPGATLGESTALSAWVLGLTATVVVGLIGIVLLLPVRGATSAHGPSSRRQLLHSGGLLIIGSLLQAGRRAYGQALSNSSPQSSGLTLRELIERGVIDAYDFQIKEEEQRQRNQEHPSPAILRRLIGQGFSDEDARALIREQQRLGAYAGRTPEEIEQLHQWTMPLTIWNIMRYDPWLPWRLWRSEGFDIVDFLGVLLGAVSGGVVAVAFGLIYPIVRRMTRRGFLRAMLMAPTVPASIMAAVSPTYLLLTAKLGGTAEADPILLLNSERENHGWTLDFPVDVPQVMRERVRRLALAEAAVHETAHHLYRHASHEVVYAMGFLRLWELGIAFHGREPSFPELTWVDYVLGTHWRRVLCETAWTLGHDAKDPRVAWHYLCTIAELTNQGLSLQRAERVARGRFSRGNTRDAELAARNRGAVRVGIPTSLRRLTAGAEELSVRGGTLGALIDEMNRYYPGIKERLVYHDRLNRAFDFYVYVGGEEIRLGDALDAPIPPGAEVQIVLAIAGGAPTDEEEKAARRTTTGVISDNAAPVAPAQPTATSPASTAPAPSAAEKASVPGSEGTAAVETVILLDPDKNQNARTIFRHRVKRVTNGLGAVIVAETLEEALEQMTAGGRSIRAVFAEEPPGHGMETLMTAAQQRNIPVIMLAGWPTLEKEEQWKRSGVVLIVDKGGLERPGYTDLTTALRHVFTVPAATPAPTLLSATPPASQGQDVERMVTERVLPILPRTNPEGQPLTVYCPVYYPSRPGEAVVHALLATDAGRYVVVDPYGEFSPQEIQGTFDAIEARLKQDGTDVVVTRRDSMTAMFTFQFAGLDGKPRSRELIYYAGRDPKTSIARDARLFTPDEVKAGYDILYAEDSPFSLNWGSLLRPLETLRSGGYVVLVHSDNLRATGGPSAVDVQAITENATDHRRYLTGGETTWSRWISQGLLVARYESPATKSIIPRSIYRAESVERVREALEKALVSIDPTLATLMSSIKPARLYHLARALETGELSESNPEKSLREEAVSVLREELREARVSNEAEQTVVNEAVKALRALCLKQGWPFTDFADNVRFVAPTAGEQLAGMHGWLLPVIHIPDNLSEELTKGTIQHEGSHHIFGGFPITWLDEAMTEYMTVLADIDPAQRIPSPNEIATSRLQPFVEYAQHGPASRVLFQRIAALKSGEIFSGYFPQVSLLEYLLHEVIPARGGVPEAFIQAYVDGDWPAAMQLLGEDGVQLCELLDEQHERVTESPATWLGFLVVGKTILEAVKEAKPVITSSGESAAPAPAATPEPLVQAIEGASVGPAGESDAHLRGRILTITRAVYGLLSALGLFTGCTVVYPAGGLDLFPAVYAPTVILNREELRAQAQRLLGDTVGGEALPRHLRYVTEPDGRLDALDVASYPKWVGALQTPRKLVLFKGFIYGYFGRRFGRLKAYFDQLDQFLSPGDRVVFLSQEDVEYGARPLLERGYRIVDDWISQADQQRLEAAFEQFRVLPREQRRFVDGGVHFLVPTKILILEKPVHPIVHPPETSSSGGAAPANASHDSQSAVGDASALKIEVAINHVSQKSESFMLPPGRFGGSGVNVVDTVLESIHDVLGVTPLVKLMGSATYAQDAEGRIDWDAVSDLDVVIYVEHPPSRFKDKIARAWCEKLRLAGVHADWDKHDGAIVIDGDGPQARRIPLHLLTYPLRTLFSSPAEPHPGHYRMHDVFVGDRSRLDRMLVEHGAEFVIEQTATFYQELIQMARAGSTQTESELELVDPKQLKALYQAAYLRGRQGEFQQLLVLSKLPLAQALDSHAEEAFRGALEQLVVTGPSDSQLRTDLRRLLTAERVRNQEPVPGTKGTGTSTAPAPAAQERHPTRADDARPADRQEEPSQAGGLPTHKQGRDDKDRQYHPEFPDPFGATPLDGTTLGQLRVRLTSCSSCVFDPKKVAQAKQDLSRYIGHFSVGAERHILEEHVPEAQAIEEAVNAIQIQLKLIPSGIPSEQEVSAADRQHAAGEVVAFLQAAAQAEPHRRQLVLQAIVQRIIATINWLAGREGVKADASIGVVSEAERQALARLSRAFPGGMLPPSFPTLVRIRSQVVRQGDRVLYVGSRSSWVPMIDAALGARVTVTEREPHLMDAFQQVAGSLPEELASRLTFDPRSIDVNRLNETFPGQQFEHVVMRSILSDHRYHQDYQRDEEYLMALRQILQIASRSLWVTNDSFANTSTQEQMPFIAARVGKAVEVLALPVVLHDHSFPGGLTYNKSLLLYRVAPAPAARVQAAYQVFDRLDDAIGWVEQSLQPTDQVTLMAHYYLPVQSVSREQLLSALRRLRATDLTRTGRRMVVLSIREEDGVKRYAALLNENLTRESPASGTGTVTVYRGSSIASARATLRHGFFGIPGRFMFYDDPALIMPEADGPIRMAFQLPAVMLVKGTLWSRDGVETELLPPGAEAGFEPMGAMIALDPQPEQMGAPLPQEVRDVLLAQAKQDESGRDAMRAEALLAAEAAGFLIHVDAGMLDMARTRELLEEDIRTGRISHVEGQQLSNLLVSVAPSAIHVTAAPALAAAPPGTPEAPVSEEDRQSQLLTAEQRGRLEAVFERHRIASIQQLRRFPRQSFDGMLDLFKQEGTPEKTVVRLNRKIETEDFRRIALDQHIDFEIALLRIRGTDQWIAIKGLKQEVNIMAAGSVYLFDILVHNHPGNSEPLPSTGDIYSMATPRKTPGINNAMTFWIAGKSGMTYFNVNAVTGRLAGSIRNYDLKLDHLFRELTSIIEQIEAEHQLRLTMSELDPDNPLHRPYLEMSLRNMGVEWQFKHWGTITESDFPSKAFHLSDLLESADPVVRLHGLHVLKELSAVPNANLMDVFGAFAQDEDEVIQDWVVGTFLRGRGKVEGREVGLLPFLRSPFPVIRAMAKTLLALERNPKEVEGAAAWEILEDLRKRDYYRRFVKDMAQPSASMLLEREAVATTLLQHIDPQQLDQPDAQVLAQVLGQQMQLWPNVKEQVLVNPELQRELVRLVQEELALWQQRTGLTTNQLIHVVTRFNRPVIEGLFKSYPRDVVTQAIEAADPTQLYEMVTAAVTPAPAADKEKK